ncbi:MAG: DUF2489 domain-containing protein [Motiliproteus sp.]|nr:DUF2489 domain-containing protein [Motiliproteus sp.]MCW9054047.1 DUF2489 domain-containing protein [Motiliproteus sp.]
MSEQLQWVLVVVGLGIVVALAMLIRHQLRQQREQKQAQQELLEDLQQQAEKQRDHLVESIRVISLAMQDEQCELAEGCIRLKVLLDHLAPYLHEHEDFSVINEMFEATKHMPILEEWKKLKIKRRFELTAEREALEQKYKLQILAAAEKLAKYRFQQ